MNFDPIALPILILAAVIFLITTIHKSAKKRAAALLSFAQERKFSYKSDDKSGEKVYMKYGFFKSFAVGRGREASNIISFQEGEVTITTFDYRYTTGSGKSKSTKRTSNIIIYKSDKNVPHFFIRREIAVFDFLGKIFGGQDINFDEDEEFSKSFVLQGDDEEQTRSFFENSLNRFPFLIFSDENVTFEGNGQYIHYQQPNFIPVDELPQKLQNIQDLFSSLE